MSPATCATVRQRGHERARDRASHSRMQSVCQTDLHPSRAQGIEVKLLPGSKGSKQMPQVSTCNQATSAALANASSRATESGNMDPVSADGGDCPDTSAPAWVHVVPISATWESGRRGRGISSGIMCIVKKISSEEIPIIRSPAGHPRPTGGVGCIIGSPIGPIIACTGQSPPKIGLCCGSADRGTATGTGSSIRAENRTVLTSSDTRLCGKAPKAGSSLECASKGTGMPRAFGGCAIRGPLRGASTTEAVWV
mmetsp:Transcript_969/g.3887  ORF Transcript_969/g.3887 Transcript_969/m.3887 type:complete len:253 (+) Transcript_969:1779-2537(+)